MVRKLGDDVKYFYERRGADGTWTQCLRVIRLCTPSMVAAHNAGEIVRIDGRERLLYYMLACKRAEQLAQLDAAITDYYQSKTGRSGMTFIR